MVFDPLSCQGILVKYVIDNPTIVPFKCGPLEINSVSASVSEMAESERSVPRHRAFLSALTLLPLCHCRRGFQMTQPAGIWHQRASLAARQPPEHVCSDRSGAGALTVVTGVAH